MNHFKDTVGNFAEEYELDQSPVKIWGVATSRITGFFAAKIAQENFTREISSYRHRVMMEAVDL